MKNKSHDGLMEPIKEFWIQNGVSSSYDMKEEIGNWGGYWVPDHKSWAITDPCESAKRVIKLIGLKLQFRRYL